MSLYQSIIEVYPELIITNDNDQFNNKGCIVLADDGDGIEYIAKWEYEKPLPDGFTLGKPQE